MSGPWEDFAPAEDAPWADFQSAKPQPKRTSNLQGFVKGAERVGNNLAPLVGVTNPSAAMALKAETDQTLKNIAEREAQGIQSGKGFEYAGGLLASAPTMFMGGPVMSGALAGYATSDSDNILGKVAGTALGAVGGKVGAAVMGKVGNVLAPVVKPAVKRLQDAGVKLTPGMIRGERAMVREDKLMSRPVVGNAIMADRQKTLETVNVAGLNNALQPLGVSLPKGIAAGHDAVNAAHDVVEQAYDAVVPTMSVRPDPRFVVGLRRISAGVQALPEPQQAQFQGVLKAIGFGRNGVLAGKQLQNAYSEIGRLSRSYSGSSSAGERELGRVLGDLRGELGEMMSRQNPQAKPDFDAANQAFSRLAVMEEAASRADGGVANTGQIKQAARKADTSRRKAATARGRGPMAQFVNDIREVVPAKAPNPSGTAGHVQFGNPLRAIQGIGSQATYAADSAILNAFTKAPPQVQATVRNVLLGLQGPAGLIGAYAASHLPQE